MIDGFEIVNDFFVSFIFNLYNVSFSGGGASSYIQSGLRTSYVVELKMTLKF